MGLSTNKPKLDLSGFDEAVNSNTKLDLSGFDEAVSKKKVDTAGAASLTPTGGVSGTGLEPSQDKPARTVTQQELAKINEFLKTGVPTGKPRAKAEAPKAIKVDLTQNILEEKPKKEGVVLTSYDEYIQKAPKAYEEDTFDIISNAFQRGLNQADLAANLTAVGGDPNQNMIAEIARIQQENRNLKTSEAYQKFNSAESFSDAVGVLTESPGNFFTVMTELSLESLTAMAKHGIVRVAVGAGTGAAMGSVIPGAGTAAGLGYGIITGMGLTSLNLEYSGKMMEVFTDMGVDTTDPKQLESVFSDDKKVAEARDLALKKGIPIAIFDAVSGGIAGRIASKPAKTLVRKAVVGGAELGTQMALGAGGEFVGQKVAGERTNWSAILGEALAEGFMAPVEVVGGATYRKIVNAPNNKEAVSRTVGMLPDNVDKANVIKDQVGLQLVTGDIDQTQAEEIVTTANKAIESEKLVPADMSKDIRSEALPILVDKYDVLSEIAQIEAQKETTDPAFHKALDARIEPLRKRVIEYDSAIENITSPKPAPTPVAVEAKPITYDQLSDDAKAMLEQDMVDVDAEIAASQEQGVEPDFTTKELLLNNPVAYLENKVQQEANAQDQETLNKIKQEQNAIQVETAGQVPVQPEATVGEQVAQGEPQAEPQAPAQEGQEVESAADRNIRESIKEARKMFGVSEAVKNVSNLFLNSGIRVKVVDSADEFATIAGTDNAQGMFRSEEGVIYLNPAKFEEGLGRLVVYHEGIHPIINIIRNTDTKLYDSVRNGLIKMARTNDSVAQSFRWISENTENKSPESIEDEQIVETLARIADGRISLDSIPRTLLDRIVEFFNTIALSMGLGRPFRQGDLKSATSIARQITKALQTGEGLTGIVGKGREKEFGFKGVQPRMVAAAPFFNTIIKDTKEADSLRKSKGYLDYLKMLNDVANEMGFKADIYEQIGGYVNDAGEKVVEISTMVDLQKASLDDSVDYASLVGVLAPEIQESTIAFKRVRKNSPRQTANEYYMTIGDVDAALAALKVVGIDNFSINETKKTISFIDVVDFKDLTLAEKITNFVNELDKNNVSYGKLKYRPIESVFIEGKTRSGNIKGLRAKWSGRKRGGKNLDNIIEQAVRRDGNRGGRISRGKYSPLKGAPSVREINGPDPQLVDVAEQYARDNGIKLRRQAEYVTIDKAFSTELGIAYGDMKHDPRNPKVKESYEDLIRQTIAQYQALVDAGYRFWFIDMNIPENAEYASTPYNALRDLRKNKEMGVFPTTDGFGSSDLDVNDNPLLAETGIMWPVGGLDGKLKPALANDIFRAVHDAFGHGLEGAGFRARGEENAWQAHVRLFYGPAVGAMTSETRGQNSWLNFGPYGDKNRTAKVEDTVFADQKTGLMPEWTWTERIAKSEDQYSPANTRNIMADVVNGFYSPIENRLMETKVDRQSANKWIGFVGKKDEVIYTGVLGWLEAKNPQEQVSKKDIMDFMKQNRIEVREVVKEQKGNKPFGSWRRINIEFGRNGWLNEGGYKIKETPRGDYELIYVPNDLFAEEESLGKFDKVNEAKEVAEAHSKKLPMATKYAAYQLPGESTDYKEVLVVLPTEPEKAVAIQVESGNWKIKYPDGSLSPFEYKSKAFAEKDIKEAIANKGEIKRRGEFRSSHWDESNILVHLRMNTRTDANGNKVLFLEEIQSDWGQTGKKEGFKSDEAYQKADDAYGKYLDRMKAKYGKDYDEYYTKEESDEEYTLLGNRDAAEKAAIPSAPFVTDTNAWTKLGLKIALKEAVRQDADALAWTTGEQQNERFGLSKTVDEIRYFKSTNPKSGFDYSIDGTKNGQKVFAQDVKESELEGIVGKDVAKRIIADEGAPVQYGKENPLNKIKEEGKGVLSGEDLKVGGKGMNAFYGDTKNPGIVGNVAVSLVGELTGTKPSPSMVEINSVEQPAIEVTPEVKDAVKQGMAQFSPAAPRGIVDVDIETQRAVKKAKGKTPKTWGEVDIAISNGERVFGKYQGMVELLNIDGASSFDLEEIKIIPGDDINKDVPQYSMWEPRGLMDIGKTVRKDYPNYERVVNEAMMAFDMGVRNHVHFSKVMQYDPNPNIEMAWNDAVRIKRGEKPMIKNASDYRKTLERMNRSELNTIYRTKELVRGWLKKFVSKQALFDSKADLFKVLSEQTGEAWNVVAAYVTVVGGQSARADYLGELFMEATFNNLGNKQEYKVYDQMYSELELYKLMLIRTRVLEIQRKMQDKFNEFKRLDDQINTNNKQISNYKKEMELLNKTMNKELKTLRPALDYDGRKDLIKQLIEGKENITELDDSVSKYQKNLEAIDKLEGQIKELETPRSYVKEYLDRNKMLIKTPQGWEMGKYKFTGGLDPISAKAQLDEIRTKHPELYENLMKRVDAYTEAFRTLLEMQLQNGIISQGSYDELIKYRYVPMQNVAYLLDQVVSGDDLKIGRNNEDYIKRLKGGSEEDINMNFDEMLKFSTFMTYRKIAQNKAAKELYNAAKDNPTNTAFYIPEAKEYDRYGNETDWYYDKHKEGLITVQIDGNTKVIATDIYTANAWNGTNKMFDAVSPNFGWVFLTTPFRAITTNLNPGFGLAQILIDVPQAILATDAYASVIYGVPAVLYRDLRLITGKALNDTANKLGLPANMTSEWDRLYVEAVNEGAIISFTRGEDMKELLGGPSVIKRVGEKTATLGRFKIGKKNIDLGNAFSWYRGNVEKFGSAMEAVTRMAVYRKKRNTLESLYKKRNGGVAPTGKDMDDIRAQAAATALNMLNYNRGGTLIKPLNNAMAYLNVGFQAFYSQQFMRSKVDAAKWAFKAMEFAAYGTLATMLPYLYLDDDEKEKFEELYNMLSDYEKYNYWHIVNPFRDPENDDTFFWRFKKPTILLPLVNSTEVYAMHNITKGKTTSPKDYSKDRLASDVIAAQPIQVGNVISSIPILNSALLYSGYDYYRDQEVVPNKDQILDYQEGLDDPNVGKFYKYIAQIGVVNPDTDEGILSPARADRAIKAAVGNYETNITTALPMYLFDSMLMALSGDYRALEQLPESEQKDFVTKLWEGTGLNKRFLTNVPEINPEYYKIKDEKIKARNSIVRSLRKDIEQAIDEKFSDDQMRSMIDEYWKRNAEARKTFTSDEYTKMLDNAETYVRRKKWFEGKPAWYRTFILAPDKELKTTIYDIETKGMTADEIIKAITPLYDIGAISDEMDLYIGEDINSKK